MIADNTEILKIVGDIENRYNADMTTNLHFAILDSKLAIIEFCGWIEQTIDEILKAYINNKLIVQSNKDYIENIIKRTYGFTYDNHLRKMMISIIGMNKLENFEDYLENKGGLLSQLKPMLEMLTQERNKAAHTFTPQGTTITYQAPSVVLSQINTITPILQEIEQEIIQY